MKVLDRGRLSVICSGDQSEMRELLQLLIESTGSLVARFAAAVGRSDLLEAKAVIHELRGTAYNAGALQLGTLAKRVDTELRTAESTDSLRAYIPALNAALHRLAAETA